MYDVHYINKETLWIINPKVKSYIVDDDDCVDATDIILGSIDDHPEIDDIQLLIGSPDYGYYNVSLNSDEALFLAESLKNKIEFNKAQRIG